MSEPTKLSEAFQMFDKAKIKYKKLFDEYTSTKIKEKCDCDRSICARCMGLQRLKEEMDSLLPPIF